MCLDYVKKNLTLCGRAVVMTTSLLSLVTTLDLHYPNNNNNKYLYSAFLWNNSKRYIKLEDLWNPNNVRTGESTICTVMETGDDCGNVYTAMCFYDLLAATNPEANVSEFPENLKKCILGTICINHTIVCYPSSMG